MGLPWRGNSVRRRRGVGQRSTCELITSKAWPRLSVRRSMLRSKAVAPCVASWSTIAAPSGSLAPVSEMCIRSPISAASSAVGRLSCTSRRVSGPWKRPPSRTEGRLVYSIRGVDPRPLPTRRTTAEWSSQQPPGSPPGWRADSYATGHARATNERWGRKTLRVRSLLQASLADTI